jgi:DNA repair photolyase
VESPDVGMMYSMNPYQGCEHGCIYCYARNVHEYWGYSAGLDFERKIIVKKNAPELLRKFLMNKNWECVPIGLSGNTDCYQPAEKKFELTKQILEVCNEFNQPIGMITKNAGILRDKDVLQEMAEEKIGKCAGEYHFFRRRPAPVHGTAHHYGETKTAGDQRTE